VSNILGFDSNEALLIASIGAIVLLCVLFPVLYAVQLALKVKPTLPRRALFVWVVTSLSYGSLMFFLFAISLPLQLYSVYVAPQLQFSGYAYGHWLIAFQDFVMGYGFVLLPVVLAVTSSFGSRYLARRWTRVVGSLSG
jgi:hypothetical protein